MPISGPDRRPGALQELRQDAVDVVDILGDVRDELVERIEAAKESLAECARRILFDFFPELRVLCVFVVNNSPPCPRSTLCALLRFPWGGEPY